MSGYSAPFVSYLLRHRAELEAGVGLPRREWQLATRAVRDWAGGAIWEFSSVLRSDLETGLGRLTPTDRELVLTAHQPGHAMAKLYSQRPTARNARLRMSVDGVLDRLTNLMNGRGEDVANGNGERASQRGRPVGTDDLPTGPAGREHELYQVFDALEAKLTRLPGVQWRSVTVSRTSDGRLDCRVTV